MYVCICNPFTDSDVEEHLETLSCSTRLGSVYTACAGGESMNCGTCACTLKKMVDDHNSKIAVGKLSADLENVVHKAKETA
jgi:bacterioferritin-associated ferredoxin